MFRNIPEANSNPASWPFLGKTSIHQWDANSQSASRRGAVLTTRLYEVPGATRKKSPQRFS